MTHSNNPYQKVTTSESACMPLANCISYFIETFPHFTLFFGKVSITQKILFGKNTPSNVVHF